MPDVFILGAGFSKAVSDCMPTMAGLSTGVLASMREPELDKLSALYPGDIEMWMTYLAQEQPWLPEQASLRNRALFLDLSQAVQEHVQDSVGQALENPMPEWLDNLVSVWDRDHAKILTLNYDCLVEIALRKATIQRHGYLHCSDLYPVVLSRAGARTDQDQPPGPRNPCSAQLFKLHGSTNWLYSGRTAFYGETIYCADVRNDWCPTATDWEDADFRAVNDKVPFIVPPVLGKTEYFEHETLRDLWRRAGLAVYGASRIFCIGYSLPKTDGLMQLFLSLNRPDHHVPFILVNTENLKDHYADLLPSPYAVDPRYIGPDCVRQLAGDLLEQAQMAQARTP